MTNFDSAFRDFGRFYIGSDDLLSRLNHIHDVAAKAPNYPPYNIRKTGDVTYQIELAVAGFCREDLDVDLQEDILTVTGSAEDDADNLIHRGIATRSFTRTFTLNNDIVVKNAELVNGMLCIYLERIIPEHKKPRKIALSAPEEKVLLTE